MKKLIALVLVITFIGMHCATYEKGEGINLEPGQKPGAKLVIQKKDGQQVKGELIAVKNDSLLLKELESGADWAVAVAEIKTITIVKKSKVWKGIGYGFIGGVCLGAFLGLADGDDPDQPGSLFFAPLKATDKAVIGGIFFGLIGIILGGLIGAGLGQDKTAKLEEKSDLEIKEILEKLRKEARVSDFQ